MNELLDEWDADGLEGDGQVWGWAARTRVHFASVRPAPPVSGVFPKSEEAGEGDVPPDLRELLVIGSR